LGFFADLVTTGTVLGVDHTSDLAAVEEVLGRDVTFEAPYGMISDFGLVEFGWHRDGPQQDWAVTYFGAQTHRLPWLTQPRENRIETALVNRYGPFQPRLGLDELRTAVHARGFTLEERPSLNDGCAEYWEPTSRIGLIAVSDPDESGTDEPAGTVLKVLGPQNRPAWLRFRGREKSFNSYATHLLTLSEMEQLTWLDKREPETDPERTDWWSYLRSVVTRRTRDTPTANQWRQLGLALNRHAAERGIDTADEAATTLLVSLTHQPGPADESPTMDEAVERWLTATTTLAQATRLATDRPLDPAGIRLSRRLRNQIHDIQPCLPHVTSAAMAHELRAWIDLKPALLRLPVTGTQVP
jgi:hypothetical protein